MNNTGGGVFGNNEPPKDPTDILFGDSSQMNLPDNF